MADKRVQFAVANLGSISDVLLSTPLLQSLRESHPSCRITYIVARSSAQVLDYSPFVNELIIWPDSKAPATGLRMVRQLARKHFDEAYALISNSYINAALRLSRSPIRTPGLPQLENNKLHYTVTPTERREAQMMLERWNIDPARETVVAMYPGSSAAAFLEIADYVAEKPQHKIVLLGEAEQRQAAAALMEKSNGNMVDLTSCLSFREFVGVLSLCHLLVHTTSEPMLLANAVHVPSLSVQAITEFETMLKQVNASRITNSHQIPSA